MFKWPVEDVRDDDSTIKNLLYPISMKKWLVLKSVLKVNGITEQRNGVCFVKIKL